MNLLSRIYRRLFAQSAARPAIALGMPRLGIETREAMFGHFLDAAPDGAIAISLAGNIVMANAMIETIFGYVREELIGQRMEILLADRHRRSHQRHREEYQNARRSRPMDAVPHLSGKRKDGSIFPVEIGLGVPTEGRDGYSIAFVRDTTERRQQEEQLLHQATHDGLTSLPNRWLFLDRLHQAIAHAGRGDNRIAVLMLDLDDFKTVNEAFGDSFGDELLAEVAKRLRNLLREEDTLARLGGDEFGILLANLDGAAGAAQVAEKILLNLSVPCTVNGQSVTIGASVGLSFFPEDGTDSDTLLRHADIAMYQAKRAGRGTYVAFSGSMGLRIQEDLHLHVRLKHALDVGELRLHYQPQVDVATAKIVGAEALLRWHDEELGEVSPARFIPVAEATGLILPIGDWVIETACKQIAIWSNAGTPLKVAVNLSPQQLHQRDLAGRLREILAATGALPALLELEITETTAIERTELVEQQLAELGDLGIGIALDDFGTGYSSFGYLKTLPITKLKLDQSFVKDLPGNVNDASIVCAIIALAKSLNLMLVAEGVETDEQRLFLHQHGCETYQGWLFSKAVSAAAVGSMLSSQSLDAPFPSCTAIPGAEVADDASRDSRNLLEEKVRERTADLVTTNSKLLQEKTQQAVLIGQLREPHSQLLQSEIMASVGQLAAGVAHEINNPVGFVNSNLGSMRRYVDGLLQLLATYEDIEDQVPEHARTEVDRLKRELDLTFVRTDIDSLLTESLEGLRRVKRIIDDLKHFTHTNATEWQWDSIEQGLDSTVSLLRNELQCKAEVIMEYGGIPEIECIPAQLNQVFMNLLVNAAQAIEHRGRITLLTGANDDSVWIEVTDTGKGIAPEHLGRVFEPFFTTRPNGKGVGLGLSLAYEIVKRHGGRIEIESELGTGSLFRVVLPRHVERSPSQHR